MVNKTSVKHSHYCTLKSPWIARLQIIDKKSWDNTQRCTIVLHSIIHLHAKITNIVLHIYRVIEKMYIRKVA